MFLAKTDREVAGFKLDRRTDAPVRHNDQRMQWRSGTFVGRREPLADMIDDETSADASGECQFHEMSKYQENSLQIYILNH